MPLSPILLHQFYELFVNLTSRHVLQLRSHAAMCNAIGRVVEADVKSATPVFLSASPAPSFSTNCASSVGAGVVHCLSAVITESLFTPSPPQRVGGDIGNTARALAAMSALCDSLEQLDPVTLLSTVHSATPGSTSILFTVWSTTEKIIAQHMASASATSSSAAVDIFHEEIIALALDCVSATCDVFEEHYDCDDASNSGAQQWDDVIPQAFSSTSMSFVCFCFLVCTV